MTMAPLVGRSSELAALLEAVAKPPSIVVVEGETGVGKSRLVAELLARPELVDRVRLVGRCGHLRHPLPLAPVVDALGGPLPGSGTASGPFEAVRAMVLSFLAGYREGSADGPGGDPLAERHLFFLRLVEALAGLGPTVLVLEDLQWCDEVTADLVEFLAPQLPSGLSLIVTYRREELDARSGLSSLRWRCPVRVRTAGIQVHPLTAQETAVLTAALLPTAEVSECFATVV